MKRYVFANHSGSIQVIKTTSSHLERTLLPGQRIAFQADPSEFLEVYTHHYTSGVLADRTCCGQLQSGDAEIPVFQMAH
jgi:hypothetical protein